MTPKLLKELCLKAEEIREDSWTGTDYSVSFRQAARQACLIDPEWTDFVWLLISECWNDVQRLEA